MKKISKAARAAAKSWWQSDQNPKIFIWCSNFYCHDQKYRNPNRVAVEAWIQYSTSTQTEPFHNFEGYGKHRHNFLLKQIIFCIYNDIEKWFHLFRKLEWNVFWDIKLPHYLKKVAVLNIFNTTVKITKQKVSHLRRDARQRVNDNSYKNILAAKHVHEVFGTHTKQTQNKQRSSHYFICRKYCLKYFKW